MLEFQHLKRGGDGSRGRVAGRSGPLTRILGLLLLTAMVLWIAGHAVRRMPISCGGDRTIGRAAIVVVSTAMHMSMTGSHTGLALAFTVSLFGCLPPQGGSKPGVDIALYPGSVEFCSDHVVGAPRSDGTSGAHISWTGYYSIDPPEKVVGHYKKVLGSDNHAREDDEDVWRFPLDRPERVLSVTHPKGTFPRGQCGPPPASARTIVIISIASRG